uniref:Secreted protein n=1 Tax=Knipowitschia caucasica TaxID=637954 RepID=A0AAV2KEE5_KNICA
MVALWWLFFPFLAAMTTAMHNNTGDVLFPDALDPPESADHRGVSSGSVGDQLRPGHVVRVKGLLTPIFSSPAPPLHRKSRNMHRSSKCTHM